MPRKIFKPLSVAIVMATQLSGCAGAPARFTQTPDRFTPCSGSPNCVSSQAPRDSARHVAPLTFSGDAEHARAMLLATLQHVDNARIERATPRFVHATFHTTLGFVDDVTFIIQGPTQIIDVKSASRFGYYDFGVNRRRVQDLRARFRARLAT